MALSGGGRTITTGAGAGTITFAGTLDGAQTLALTAGTGNIDFDGKVGDSTALGAVTINAAANVTIDKAFTATVESGNGRYWNFKLGDVLTAQTGVVTINANAVDIDADIIASGATKVVSITGATDLGGDITSTNGAVTFNSAVALSGGGRTITTGAGAGTITFAGTLDGAQTLALTAGTGNIDFDGKVGDSTALGAVTINAAANVTIDKAFTAASLNQATAGTGTFKLDDVLTAQTGVVTINANAVDINADIIASGAVKVVSITGATDLGGDITSTNGAVTFNSAVDLSGGGRTITTGAGAGTITFASTLDGAQTLALTAGTGNIDFDGKVGDSTALGAVTINAAANVTIDKAFTAASLNQATAGTGTFKLGDVLTAQTGVVTINANAVDIDADIIASGATKVVSITGATDLGADITSTNGAVTFNSAVDLSGGGRTITHHRSRHAGWNGAIIDFDGKVWHARWSAT